MDNLNVETPVAEEVKVSPPQARKPGRKPGQKTGTGNSKSLFAKRKRAGKEAPVLSEAEALEAIGNAQSVPSPSGEQAPPAKRKSKGSAMGPEKFARSLQGLHKGAAFIMQEPAFALEDAEAKMMADALFDIFDEYDIVVNTKLASAVNLAGATMIVYGPRMALMRRKALAAARNRQPQPSVGNNAATPPSPAPTPQATPEPILEQGFFDIGGAAPAGGGG
jgi:hypothetical protein